MKGACTADIIITDQLNFCCVGKGFSYQEITQGNSETVRLGWIRLLKVFLDDMGLVGMEWDEIGQVKLGQDR